MTRAIDLAGQRFGHLIALRRVKASNRSRQLSWLCVCDCNKLTVVLSDNLRRGHTRSCGCLKAGTHGQSRQGNRTAEYRAWVSMKQRCYNPRSSGFPDYGGRGIGVCDEWLDSFDRFFADMGSRPSDTHSLDRIDVNGDYCASNCRWATKDVQSQNTRIQKRNSTGHRGVKRASGAYRVDISVNGSTLYLGRYSSLEDAVAVRKAAEKELWEADECDL